MTTVSRLCPFLGPERRESNPLHYKYSDLEREWILHEGTLDYLYAENLFKNALFKKYLLVLTRIVDEHTKGQMTVLYIYPDKEKSPWKSLQIKSTDKLNDRCEKVITGPPGLFFMELIVDEDKREIFGTSSVSERMLWIDQFEQAKKKVSHFRPVARTLSDGSRVGRKSTPEDASSTLRLPSVNYAPFSNRSSLANDQLSANSLPNYLSCEETTSTSPGGLYSHDEVSKEEPRSSTEFSWNEVFYGNRKNDFAQVLNDIGQVGVFLVRPPSKNTSSNHHAYTLCILDSNSRVQNFPIYQSSADEQYYLTHRENEPHFLDILRLCEHYRTNPFTVSSKDGNVFFPDVLLFLIHFSPMSVPTPQQIGKAFVIQYYRILHEHPESLHRFYSSTSTFTHDDPAKTVIGTDLIAKRIEELAFKHRSIKIRQVDCHSTVTASVVVQVCGAISSSPASDSQTPPLMKRFVQTFVLTLAENSKQKYYVHNDLFQYQDTPSAMNVIDINQSNTTPPVTPNASRDATGKKENQKPMKPTKQPKKTAREYYDDSWYYGNGEEGYLSTGYIDDQEIFIGNLSAQVTERDIHQLFRPYGNLLLVRIGNTGSQVGAANFAFVVCQSIDMAQALIADREKLFQSQKIRVEAKKRRPFPHTFRPTYPTAASPASYQSTGYPKSSRSSDGKAATK